MAVEVVVDAAVVEVVVDAAVVEVVVDDEDVDVVDDVEEVDVDAFDTAVPLVSASYPGAGNGQDVNPLVATDMYLRQMVAGNEPPVTDWPWTDFMNVPSGYPTQTAVVSLQVNPTNHASR
jgi:hypothetical protein